MPTPRKTIDQLPEAAAPTDNDMLVIQDEGITKKVSIATMKTLSSTQLDAHLADADDAHDATAVSATPAGAGVDGPNVQSQLGQLAALVDTANDAIDAINAIIATLGTDYVNTTGDTMTGPLIVKGLPGTITPQLNDGTSFGSIVADDPENAVGVTGRFHAAGQLIATAGASVSGGDLNVGGAIYQTSGQAASLGNISAQGPATFQDTVTLDADPALPLQASTKQYVDAQTGTLLTQAQADARYVNLDGDTMSGSLQTAGLSVVGGSLSVFDGDIDVLNDGEVNVTGQVNLSKAPVEADHAVRKDYVDGLAASTYDARYVNTAGDTMTGGLTVNPGSVTVNSGSVIGAQLRSRSGGSAAVPAKQLVMTFGGTDNWAHVLESGHDAGSKPNNSLRFRLWQPGDSTGGMTPTNTVLTLGGSLITAAYPVQLPGDPVNALEAATKQYVDASATTRPHLYLPGAAGNFVSAPDPAQLAGATQLDIRWIEKAPASGGAGYNGGVLATQGPASNQQSFMLSTGAASPSVNLFLNNNNAVFITRTIRPTAGVAACRVTWRSSDGRVQMFTKATADVAAMLTNTGWTQVGADGTLHAGVALPDRSDTLAIGTYSGGSASPISINLLAYSMSTTIDGTPFALWRSDTMDQVYTDAYGTRWTINGTAWEWRDANGLRIGGYSALYPVVARWRSGYWYGAPVTAVSATIPQEGVATCQMLLIPDGVALTAIGVEITGPGTAGALIRLGVYRQNETGSSGVTLMQDAGTIDGTQVAGGYELPLTIPAQPRPWWAAMAVCIQGSAATRPTMRFATTIQDAPMGRASTSLQSAMQSVSHNGFVATGVTGALPASVVNSPSELISAPRVMVRGTQS